MKSILLGLTLFLGLNYSVDCLAISVNDIDQAIQQQHNTSHNNIKNNKYLFLNYYKDDLSFWAALNQELSPKVVNQYLTRELFLYYCENIGHCFKACTGLSVCSALRDKDGYDVMESWHTAENITYLLKNSCDDARRILENKNNNKWFNKETEYIDYCYSESFGAFKVYVKYTNDTYQTYLLPID